MDAVAERDSLAPTLTEPHARIGLIIPSVNRMSEPQFNHYAPEGLAIHVARGRVAGEPSRTVAELGGEIAHAAGTLADAHPDLIVFHCTHTSMKEGADGETRILNLIRTTTGIEAVSTSSLVNEALCALGLGRRASPWSRTWRTNARARPNSRRSRRGAGLSSPATTIAARLTASS